LVGDMEESTITAVRENKDGFVVRVGEIFETAVGLTGIARASLLSSVVSAVEALSLAPLPSETATTTLSEILRRTRAAALTVP
ncbi:MAG: hypothetical protein V2I33_20310, partial [Kangiellaceae bacterium]|nr:hypothetical protein [Kangiellaceae bacterium]